MPNNDLISRAELVRDLSYSAPELFFDKDYLMTKIARQPAVPAIPMEWLNKQCEMADDLGDMEMTDVISWLIQTWQEEQEGEIVANNKPLDTAKKVIKEHYKDYDCGIFNTPNIVGDPMATIYKDNSIKILGCYDHRYFEVFGLSRDDFDRLEKYYNSLENEAR